MVLEGISLRVEARGTGLVNGHHLPSSQVFGIQVYRNGGVWIHVLAVLVDQGLFILIYLLLIVRHQGSHVNHLAASQQLGSGLNLASSLEVSTLVVC